MFGERNADKDVSHPILDCFENVAVEKKLSEYGGAKKLDRFKVDATKVIAEGWAEIRE
jgi:hypothetical protein